MIRITLENVQAQAQGDPHELAWLNSLLSYPNAKYRWTGGSETIRLLHPIDNTFPAGFTRVVYEAAQKDNHPITITDSRKRPQIDAAADLAWLRDYQQDAVGAALRRTRGYIHAPTASGKTEIAAGIARSLPTCKLAFLVHRNQLADQTRKRFAMRIPEVPVGFIAEGEWEPDRVTVATFQSLWSRLADPKRHAKTKAWLESLDAFIVDECHVIPARTFTAILDYCCNAYFRIGVSGTPVAGGGEKAVAVLGRLGPVVYRIRPEVLIANGSIAMPTIKMVPVLQTMQMPPAINRFQQARLWHKVNKELVVNSRARNDAIVRMVQAAQKPSMVFVQNLKHGEKLLASLRHGGLNCEFVEGKISTEYRNQMIKQLERGDIDVLVATVVFNEGVDIPTLQSVVIAAGGKSPIAAIQRVGRGMRIAAGKTTFEVWDVQDEGVGMLERHTKERLKAYKNEGYKIEVAPGYVKR